MTRHAAVLALALLLQPLACASELQTDIDDGNTAGNTSGGTTSSAGTYALAGTTTTTTGGARGGTTGTASVGGHAGTSGGGGNRSSGGSASGGAGGKANAGGAGSGNGGNGNLGGSLNQPAQCDETTATVLGTMNSNVAVTSNICLKITLPADQTWIKKITLQPDSGTYPLPFSWSNCGTNSTGAFTANYANTILTPVTAQCPILIKLTGTGAPINVQWWGG